MSSIESLVSQFPSTRILVIGDLMLDHYIWGKVRRISPEAPVPVVDITHEDYRLGGAANVVHNVFGLGSRVCVSGILGDDAMGQLFLSQISDIVESHGCHIVPNGRPTTTKMRVIASRQQIVRVDRENSSPAEPEALDAMMGYVEERLPETDTIVVSDYGKGAITAELVERLVKQVKAANKKRDKPVRIIVDPKGSDYSRYKGVDLIKPNLLEAEHATGINTETDIGLDDAGHRIMNEVGCHSVLITCGERGMVLFQKGASTLRIPTEPRETFEVSGAGDTVSAALAVSLAAGADLITACRIANAAAWVVVGKVGIANVTPDELLHALQEMELS